MTCFYYIYITRNVESIETFIIEIVLLYTNHSDYIENAEVLIQLK